MRKLLTLVLAACSMAALGQTKSLPEFMASAGFTQVNDSTWTIAGRATVTMQGNYVKAFEAKQNHNWTMAFGNGGKQGAVVNVKSGDKIVFSNGRLTFANGSAYCPMSLDSVVLFKRGILRSAIFNKQRNALFATDIKTEKPSATSLGQFFPAKSAKGYTLDEYGNFKDKVESANKALQAKRDQNWTKAQQSVADYNAHYLENLYKQYGRNVIDGVINGNIMVGAPIDLVMKMMEGKVEGGDFLYASKIVSSNAYTETREFYPSVHNTHDTHIHYFVTYNQKTQRVTGYYTKKRYY